MVVEKIEGDQSALEVEKFDKQLATYKEELITLLHKSQDTFEKQLSYISAGALGLSIAFLKDIIIEIGSSKFKWVISAGWILLIVCLLLNCLSHIWAAQSHNKTIGEITSGKYNSAIVERRNRTINRFNIGSVATMLLGILAIIIFITINF